MYDKFVELMCGGDAVKVLGTDGESIWDEIKTEYCDLVKTKRSESVFKVWNTLQSLDIKYKNIKVCTWALKVQYDAEIAEILASFGYDLVQDIEDRETYLKQIYAIEMEAKTLVILINQYHNEYKLLCPENEAIKVRTVQDYDEELAILSKYQGYKIRKREETVSEVGSIINNYLKEHGTTI